GLWLSGGGRRGRIGVAAASKPAKRIAGESIAGVQRRRGYERRFASPIAGDERHSARGVARYLGGGFRAGSAWRRRGADRGGHGYGVARAARRLQRADADPGR